MSRVLLAPVLLAAEPQPEPDYTPDRGYSTRESFFKSRELEFLRRLDSGGFAEVVLVRRRHLGTELAVKFFAPHPFNADTEGRRSKARARLLREGNLLAAIRHSNVVRLVDCSLVAGDPALVLEYVNGNTLDSLRQQSGPLAATGVLGYMTQVLDALAECHSLGIAHRDVSPKNIVVEGSGRAVLIDFGLGVSEEFSVGTRLTTQVIGTPGFRAPELDRDPLLATPAVDVFAAAAVAVFLLTGHPPQLGVQLAIEGAPPSLVAILQRGLEPNPIRRITSAEQFRDALRALTSKPAGSPRTPPLGGVLSEPDLREFLGIDAGNDTSPEVLIVMSQFGVGVSRLFGGDQPEVGLALLLAAARRQLDIYWSASEPANGCDFRELKNVLGRLLAVLSGTHQIQTDRVIAGAFALASSRGWLDEHEYDSWVPGMKSGSGRRSCLYPTTLGLRWLAVEALFDPPRADVQSRRSPF